MVLLYPLSVPASVASGGLPCGLVGLRWGNGVDLDAVCGRVLSWLVVGPHLEAISVINKDVADVLNVLLIGVAQASACNDASPFDPVPRLVGSVDVQLDEPSTEVVMESRVAHICVVGVVESAALDDSTVDEEQRLAGRHLHR